MVQAKTLFPKPNPVTLVPGDNELVIVPEPETKVQTPVPIVAVLAVIKVFGLLIHNVWLEPALDIVGTSFTIMATVALDGAHGAFEISH